MSKKLYLRIFFRTLATLSTNTHVKIQLNFNLIPVFPIVEDSYPKNKSEIVYQYKRIMQIDHVINNSNYYI